MRSRNFATGSRVNIDSCNMSKPRDEVRIFLRAAHRRWVAWRALELAALGVLVGCAIALPLLVILWWREQSAVPTVMLILALGAFFGAIVGMVKRPTLLDTAVEADRQFRLHDLLGTALTLRACRYLDDPWRANLHTIAERCCRGLSPSQLVLHRLGARAWGGIGLSAALVLTLSLMTATPTQTSAQANDGRQIATFESVPTRPNAAPGAPSRSRLAMSKGQSPSDREEDRPPPIPAPDAAGSDSTPTGAGRAREGNAGGGAGAAETIKASPPSRMEGTGMRAANRDPSGAHAAGAGFATGSTAEPDDALSSGTAGTTWNRPVAPWQSPTWQADRAAALRALETPRVPDRYRDLVREYFSRHPE